MIHVSALLFGCLLWGLAWWPMKMLNGLGLDASMLTLVAYAAAAFAVLPRCLCQRVALLSHRRTLLCIFVSGGCWCLCYSAAMVSGEASRVILLYYLSSIWTIIGGHVILKESLDARRWLCILMVLGGAALVLIEPSRFGGIVSVADVLALIAGLSHAVTNITYRFAEHIPVSTKNAALFLGGVATAALAISLQQPTVSATSISAQAWLAGAAFGLCWVLVADSLTQFGVSHLPASRSAVLLISELVFTVASAALLASEHLSPMKLLGGALIATATVFEVARGDCERSPAADKGNSGNTKTAAATRVPRGMQSDLV